MEPTNLNIGTLSFTNKEEKMWDVMNETSGQCIGYVSYWDDVEKYLFSASEDANLSEEELADVILFLKKMKG
jgi:hypothetical protein